MSTHNNTQPSDTQCQDIVAAVVANAGHVQEVSARQWRLSDGQRRSIQLSLDGAWLNAFTRLSRRDTAAVPGARRAAELLLANAGLPAGMCYGIGTRHPGVYLCLDMQLEAPDGEAGNAVDVVSNRLDAFRQAARKSPTAFTTQAEALAEILLQPITADDELGESTRGHCEQMGWEYHERGNGQLAISLEVPRQFCQAFAYSSGPDDYRLVATLDITADPPAIAAHAMTTYLLAASRAIRLARATAVPTDGPDRYRWEVHWPHLPTAGQFHTGLTSLSMACRWTRRELHALTDASIADRYLKLRGRSPQ